MKKLIKTVSLFLMMALMLSFGLTLSACSNDAPTEEQLVGRWRLIEHHYNPGGHTYVPGDEKWLNEYFIEFRANGTFSELDFWLANSGGTWELNGNSLTLTRTSGVDVIYPFVSERTISINEDGDTIIITYRRRYYNRNFRIRDTFTRA